MFHFTDSEFMVLPNVHGFQPMQETLNHVFCFSDLANAAWYFFGSAVGSPPMLFQFDKCLQTGGFKQSKNIYVSFIWQLLPSFICRNLWKVRNKARFQGELVDYFQVLSSIFRDIFEAFEIKFPGGIHSTNLF